MTKRELIAKLAPYGMDDEVIAKHWDADDDLRMVYCIESVDESPDGPVLIIAEVDAEVDDDSEET